MPERTRPRVNSRPEADTPEQGQALGPAVQQADALRLQRTAGNQAVARLLAADPGRPLEPALREQMEAGFETDFSSVRIHSGADAAASAKQLGARAYTSGEHVVIRDYAPGTSVGRILLAHELAHVLQQREAAGALQPGTGASGDAFELQANTAAGLLASCAAPAGAFANGVPGPAPTVQLEEDPQEQARLLAQDQVTAQMTELLYSNNEYSSTDILLSSARHLNFQFRDARSVRTQLATARALLDITRVLKKREKSAERDGNGVLMRQDLGEMVPWTTERPARLEDIPPFSPENSRAWLGTVYQYAPPEAVSEPGANAEAEAARAEAPQAAPQTASPEEEKDERTMLVGTGLKAPEEEVTEENAPGTLGPEVRRGLNELDGATVGDALEAMSAGVKDTAESFEQKRDSRPVRGQNAKLTLLRASGRVYYLANRVYSLDRTGHITPGDFDFHLNATSLERGGVYFYGPFALAIEGSTAVSAVNLLVRVDGGKPQVARGDFYPKYYQEGYFPLIGQIRPLLESGAGIGLIVSDKFAETEQTFTDDFSIEKVLRAIDGASGYLDWAIRSRLRQAKKHPEQELIDLARDFAMAKLAKLLPVVGQLMKAYQALTMAKTVSELINIAAYARTDDEINIVSMALARWAAEEAVSRAKAHYAQRGIRAAQRGLRGAGAEGAAPTGPRQQKTPAPPERAPGAAPPAVPPAQPPAARPVPPPAARPGPPLEHLPARPAETPQIKQPPHAEAPPAKPAVAPGAPAQPARKGEPINLAEERARRAAQPATAAPSSKSPPPAKPGADVIDLDQARARAAAQPGPAADRPKPAAAQPAKPPARPPEKEGELIDLAGERQRRAAQAPPAERPKAPAPGKGDADIIDLSAERQKRATPPTESAAEPAQAQLQATGTGGPVVEAQPPQRISGPTGSAQQPPTVASAGSGGTRTSPPPPQPVAPVQTGRTGPTVRQAPPEPPAAQPRAPRERQAQPRRTAPEPEAPAAAPPPRPNRPVGSPPPEPKMPDGVGSVEERARALGEYRRHLGSVRQQKLDALQERLDQGSISKKARKQADRDLKNWEKAARKNIRDEYACELDRRLPFPVKEVQAIQKNEGGDWERAMRSQNEKDPRLSMTSRTKDGEEVQLDGFDWKRNTAQELKSTKSLLNEPFIDEHDPRIHKYVTQMEKQARFAEDWKITYEWVPLTQKMKADMETIKARLIESTNGKLGKRIVIVDPLFE